MVWQHKNNFFFSTSPPLTLSCLPHILPTSKPDLNVLPFLLHVMGPPGVKIYAPSSLRFQLLQQKPKIKPTKSVFHR